MVTVAKSFEAPIKCEQLKITRTGSLMSPSSSFSDVPYGYSRERPGS